MGTRPLTPQDHTWRLRPRDGEARALAELWAQKMWRHRIEATLAYIAVCVTIVILYGFGLL